MMNRLKLGALGLLTVLLSACGGGGGGSSAPTLSTGQFIDAQVGGLTYSCHSTGSTTNSGVTNAQGQFSYYAGQSCTFSVGNVTVGSVSSVPSDGVVTPQDVAGVSRSATTDPGATAIAQFLQSINTSTSAGTITISTATTQALGQSTVASVSLVTPTGIASQATLSSLVQTVKSAISSTTMALVPAATAQTTLAAQMTANSVSTNTGLVNSSSTVTLTSIAISGVNSSVPVGITDQLTATGHYSDGSTKDITGSVTWSVATSSTASISSAGVLKGLAQATSNITATLSGVSATTPVTVSAPILQSISISPSSPSTVVAETVSLTVTGYYSDGSNSALTSGLTWASSATSVATVSSAGVVSGVTAGTSIIQVTDGSVTASVTVTVANPTIVSIVVSAVSNTIQVGYSTVLNVIANLSNNLTQAINSGVQWVVSAVSGSSGSATVSSTNGSYSLLGVTAGNVDVAATYSNVSSTPIQANIINQIYFTEIPNSINVNYPANTFSNENATAIDINGDGKLDLVFHFQGQGSGSSVTPNQIAIYIQQSDGTFVDQTSAYLIGSTDLGGTSRKAKVVDINGDRKPDILFAVNQEDGRVISNSSDANAQMAALVSVGDKYKIIMFGTPNWYHSVGYGFDSNGKPFVMGNGYSTQSVGSFYIDYLGNSSLTNLNTPNVSPTSFEFISSTVNVQTDLLLQANNDSTNYTAVEGYQQTNGSWSQLQSISLAPQIGNVYAIGYDGQSQGLGYVFNANGNAITFAGLSETCQISLFPNSSKIVIFKLSGAVIPNFTDGMTVSQNSLNGYQTLKGVQVTNGAMTISPFTINNEQTTNVNSNFFDCQDVNGDGYADIVVYPYNSNGLPYVYLNNKNGGFTYINQDKFPKNILDGSWGNSATSILKDFDGDGIPDLLIFPGNGITPSNPVKYRFFKGQKYLQ